MTDDQVKLADSLLATITYELEQLFYGSEAKEWSAEVKIAKARSVLSLAMEKLPVIITD